MDTVRCTSCFKADKSQIDLHNKIRCTLVFPGHEKGEPRPCCQIQIIPLCFYISWLWRLNDDYQCWEMVSNNCFNGFIFPDSGDWTQNDYQCWEMVICNWVIGHWFYMVWPSCNLLAQLAIGELQSEKWWFAIGRRIVMQLGHTIVSQFAQACLALFASLIYQISKNKISLVGKPDIPCQAFALPSNQRKKQSVSASISNCLPIASSSLWSELMEREIG